jgi:hypothetical protein
VNASNAAAPALPELATRAVFVLLQGGLAVPFAALQLALDLEARGIVLAVDGSDLVVDDAAGLLTETDRPLIRRWKQHLVAIATYRVPEVVM